MDLRFKQGFSGGIRFVYTWEASGKSYEFSDSVPRPVVEKGKDAILAYVSKEIEKTQAKQQRHEDAKERIKKTPIPIRTVYEDGTRLDGFITEITDDRYIKVRLEKPVKSRSHIHFGFGSPSIFTANHKLTEDAIDGAKRALGWAYRDVLEEPTKDLIVDLNRQLASSQPELPFGEED